MCFTRFSTRKLVFRLAAFCGLEKKATRRTVKFLSRLTLGPRGRQAEDIGFYLIPRSDPTRHRPPGRHTGIKRNGTPFLSCLRSLLRFRPPPFSQGAPLKTRASRTGNFRVVGALSARTVVAHQTPVQTSRRKNGMASLIFRLSKNKQTRGGGNAGHHRWTRELSLALRRGCAEHPRRAHRLQGSAVDQSKDVLSKNAGGEDPVQLGTPHGMNCPVFAAIPPKQLLQDTSLCEFISVLYEKLADTNDVCGRSSAAPKGDRLLPLQRADRLQELSLVAPLIRRTSDAGVRRRDVVTRRSTRALLMCNAAALSRRTAHSAAHHGGGHRGLTAENGARARRTRPNDGPEGG